MNRAPTHSLSATVPVHIVSAKKRPAGHPADLRRFAWLGDLATLSLQPDASSKADHAESAKQQADGAGNGNVGDLTGARGFVHVVVGLIAKAGLT